MASPRRPPRKRTRLVPKDGIEVYEIRVVQWMDKEGEVWHSVDISDPNNRSVTPHFHEVLGSLEEAKAILAEDYFGNESVQGSME